MIELATRDAYGVTEPATLKIERLLLSKDQRLLYGLARLLGIAQ